MLGLVLCFFLEAPRGYLLYVSQNKTVFLFLWYKSSRSIVDKPLVWD